MTAARLRYAPWNDPNPTETAPTAPKALTDGWPQRQPDDRAGSRRRPCSAEAAIPSNWDHST